jgi:hypothetical protein
MTAENFHFIAFSLQNTIFYKFLIFFERFSNLLRIHNRAIGPSKKTMNTKQLNKLTMYLAVKGVCDAETAIWQSVQAFADAYADLQTRVTNIQTFSQTQTQNTTGIAQDKKAARLAMCGLALPIAKAVHAYAVKNKDNTLAMSVDFSMGDLVEGRDVQSRDNCQNIYATANTNLANLANYGMTAAKLTALNNAIAAFNLLISKPRDTRAHGKTITTSIQAEFDAADEDLGIMDDLLGQITDATFVSDYNNARIIVDIAASHASPAPPAPPAAPHP